jgi:hypothetical protein
VFREGQVVANSRRVFKEGYSLVYSNSTLPGMGGAVLNSSDEPIVFMVRAIDLPIIKRPALIWAFRYQEALADYDEAIKLDLLQTS